MNRPFYDLRLKMLAILLFVTVSLVSCKYLPGFGGGGEKAPPAVRPRPRAATTARVLKKKEEVKQKKAVTAEEVIKKEKYTYDPNKRDPFKPFIVVAKVEVGENIPPLLKYDLSQLRVTGIVWGSMGNVAMVEDSSGKGYVVKKGDRIGRRNGVVVRIERDKIVVEEQYEDRLGRLKKKERTMELHPVEKGGRR